MQVKQQSRFQPTLAHVGQNVQDGVLGSSLDSGYNMGLPESRVFLRVRSVLNLWKTGKAYLGVFTNLLLNIHPFTEDDQS